MNFATVGILERHDKGQKMKTIPAKKLTKPQRAKLMTLATKAFVSQLGDEEILSLHDLTHEEMDRRSGTHVRDDFARKIQV